jgi:hypothetical protein
MLKLLKSLNFAAKKHEWPMLMARLIGIANPPMTPNEIETTLQCHYYFKDMVSKWIENNPTLAQGKILENMKSNPDRGQQSPIFTVIQDIRNSNID